MHKPRLEPRDEVIFLLTAAAEIEKFRKWIADGKNP
jgi:hypothetical protein